MPKQQFTLREQEPALNAAGIAVRYFDTYRSPDWSRHGHDIVEMNFVVRGTGQHLLGDEITDIGPGMLGIIHYGQIHGYRTTGMDLYNIYVDPRHHPLPDIGDTLRPYVARFLPLHPELAHNRNRVMHLMFRDTAAMEHILALMAAESRERTTGFEEALQAGYRLFLVQCARQMAARAVTPIPADSTALGIEELRLYLDASFRDPLTLDHLAEKSGLAPTYLCRVFKKYTGRTVIQYLIQRRVEAAMLRLTSTTDKILSIAYECGFGDLAHFNRTFKKITGMSPSGYRKRTG